MTSSRLDEFLARNTIQAIEGTLPLVHSTKSLNLRDLIKSSGLNPEKCDVFPEKLIYFFLGRPAYRWNRPEGEPQDWELPTCFVFDKIPSLSVKRVFPFDSGAHDRGVYPSYVQNIPRENFESANRNAPERIISAIYGNIKSYVKGMPKSESDLRKEFDLTIMDSEILAIRKLAQDGTPEGFDDRRFSIEIQSDEPVDFKKYPPSAVILPTSYLELGEVREKLEEWGSEIINYDTYGLSLQLYYGAVFYKFMEYCKYRGFAV